MRLARLGVERRVHATGEHKGMLDPFRPEREGDLELLRGIQADILERFIAHVRDRRGSRLKGDGALFDGRVWTGAAARAARPDRRFGRGAGDGPGTVRQGRAPGPGQPAAWIAAAIALARRAGA